MLKDIFRDRYLLLLLFFTLLIRLLALKETWVETYYTAGFYPYLAGTLRTIFGWLPFSIGDLLYILAFVWLVWKTWKLVSVLKNQRWKQHLSWVLLRKYLKLSLLIYLVFMIFWGINYHRQGIGPQTGIQLKPYSVEDLFAVTLVLQQRLNSYAEKIDSVQRLTLNQNGALFKMGVESYQAATTTYPFLTYTNSSLKPSFFTPVGHLFGFTGYYNPFTAEAQLKTSVPVFLKPFIVNHEIAHQVGYAKENEASFVAYLTCKASGDVNFLYSVYFELYRDALFACRVTPNKELIEALRKNIHPRVFWDDQDLQLYLLRNRNFVEPFITDVYDRYLKLNNQPKGKATYNEVIAYLIAYMKKFGKNAI